MAQDRHSEEFANKKFCARCPCDHNNYVTICDPGWGDANLWKFAQRISKTSAGRRNYEAHHILCWSPVVEVFFEEKAKPIVEGTEWCVNNATNMIAMPVWGHTVQWYSSSQEPPPFTGLPQHDRDHNTKAGFTKEVLDELKSMIKDLKKAQAQHKLPPPAAIKGALDTKSRTFRTTLQTRGQRGGGTHANWMNGATNKKWYLPFSMASDANATPRTYARVTESKLAAIRAAEALLGS